MAERDPLGVHIGSREIYDEIIGMRDDVRSLTQHQAETVSRLADHETRLRSIERWKYTLPITSVTALGGAVAALITSFGGK
jgi:hypothetical protein